MRYFFTILCLLLLAAVMPCGVCAQTDLKAARTHVKITFKTDLPIEWAYVGHFTEKEFIKVPYKETLEFDFTSNGADFYHINYLFKDTAYNARLYLDNGNIDIVAAIENGKFIVQTVVGSPLYDMTQVWRKQYVAAAADTDQEVLSAFLLKTYEEQLANLFSFSIGSKYLELHRNNKLKLYALLPLIAKQDPELKKRFGFSSMNDRLEGILGNNAIRLADFDVLDKDKKTSRLSGRGTNYVLLDFWFVGCVPCIADHKKIRQYLPQLKQKGVEVISISTDKSFETWQLYVRKNPFSWQSYKMPATGQNLVHQLGITICPDYVLLDKNGLILFNSHKLEEIIKEIK